jgi:hypothetical protein
MRLARDTIRDARESAKLEPSKPLHPVLIRRASLSFSEKKIWMMGEFMNRQKYIGQIFVIMLASFFLLVSPAWADKACFTCCTTSKVSYNLLAI